MATYNGAQYLQDQLDSLLAQELVPLELVITYDGSMDKTIALIEEFSLYAPFPVRLEKNTKRLGYGRNFLKAATMCKGNHVAFCDQDDIWLPHKLIQVSLVLETGDYDLVAHSAKVVYLSLNWLGVNFLDINSSGSLSLEDSNRGDFWPGFTLIVSRSLLQVLESGMGQIGSTTGDKFAHDELNCEFASEQRP